MAEDVEDMEIDRNDENTSKTPVQSLVAGRARRSTAGNRLAALLDQEEKDDIDLLFEENDDDGEFQGKEESDVELGSSSDEEDRAGDEDELAGEKELERETRVQKSRAKKIKESFPGQAQLEKLFNQNTTRQSRQKRVTIQEPGERISGENVATVDDEAERDGTSHADPLDDKLRKKSERISWIPTPDDKPSRQSSRRQTVANKKVTHQRLKEAEERRVKTITAMNEAQSKRKRHTIEWTQEMRLEQAKKNEIHNLKSLNKWEEAEAARLEARKAKLAALHAKKLEGPIISIYSARADYDENAKLIRVGKRDYVEELPELNQERIPKKRGPKGKRIDREAGQMPDESRDVSVSKDVSERASEKPSEDMAISPPKQFTDVESPTPRNESTRETSPEKAQLQQEALSAETQDTPLATIPDIAAVTPVVEEGHSHDTGGPLVETSKTAHQDIMEDDALPSLEEHKAVEQNQHTNIATDEQAKVDESEPLKPKVDPTYAARTFVVLQNFNADAIKNRDYQAKVLFPSNKGSLHKPDKPLCVVTNQVARFRDPGTGLPYADLLAYKQIQRVRRGEVLWNDAYQCFIASAVDAAAGVPEGLF